MSNPFDRAAAIQRAKRKAGVRASYAGAQSHRLTTDWVLATLRSADQEVKSGLTTLKKRARELVRNDPHAARFLDMLETNIVGHEGVSFQAAVTEPTPDPEAPDRFDTETNKAIESAFREWSEPETCTADGRMGLVDVCAHAVRTRAQDGEAFIRLLPAFPNNRFRFALQVVDPDQLDEKFDREPGTGPGGDRLNEVRMGVEVDAWKRPVAYHFHDEHPSEGMRRRRLRVPAAQMVHYYRPERAGQTRGVSEFAPVLMRLRMLHGYEEAELVASRMAAAKGGFFERDPEGVLDPDRQPDSYEWEMEPGLAEALPPGWKFRPWDPEHPTTAFEAFQKTMLRSVAAGWGVSYHVLSSDLTDVSFSSIRAGTLAERDAYRIEQFFLIRHLLRRVYHEWLRWSLTSGALALPVRDVFRLRAHKWQPRGWDWVDPEKDLKAAMMELRLKVNSRTRIAGERGRDFEEILDEQLQEEKAAEQRGQTLTTDVSRGGEAKTNGNRIAAFTGGGR